jgi:hypothetical protein
VTICCNTEWNKSECYDKYVIFFIAMTDCIRSLAFSNNSLRVFSILGKFSIADNFMGYLTGDMSIRLKKDLTGEKNLSSQVFSLVF